MKTSLLLGTRKGLIRYQMNPNGQWKHQDTQFDGIPVSIATYDPYNDYYWALLDHGHWGCKLHRSKNGTDWEELETPKFPEGEVIKDDIEAVVKYLWAFSSGGADKPGAIYIGTEPGGLFISNNNGDSFELVRSLWDHPSRKTQWFGGGRDYPGIHSIVVHPNDSNHIYIGISCAGVFESKDGGTTWAPRNDGLKADFLPDPTAEVGHDPHLLAMCTKHPEVLWQQNHCGIFRTFDGGQSWKDISDNNGPADFGFAIAAHSTNPDVAWVVPGVSDEVRVAVDHALCVCRTDDAGKSWKVLREGLPQENVFDITYRHALDVAGENVVFGTTTGNLYSSANGGDSWRTVGNNLPMIYSVEIVNLPV